VPAGSSGLAGTTLADATFELRNGTTVTRERTIQIPEPEANASGMD
jgi:hypothetical protein